MVSNEKKMGNEIMNETMDYSGYVCFDPSVPLVGIGAPAKESQREQ